MRKLIFILLIFISIEVNSNNGMGLVPRLDSVNQFSFIVECRIKALVNNTTKYKQGNFILQFSNNVHLTGSGRLEIKYLAGSNYTYVYDTINRIVKINLKYGDGYMLKVSDTSYQLLWKVLITHNGGVGYYSNIEIDADTLLDSTNYSSALWSTFFNQFLPIIFDTVIRKEQIKEQKYTSTIYNLKGQEQTGERFFWLEGIYIERKDYGWKVETRKFYIFH